MNLPNLFDDVILIQFMFALVLAFLLNYVLFFFELVLEINLIAIVLFAVAFVYFKIEKFIPVILGKVF